MTEEERLIIIRALREHSTGSFIYYACLSDKELLHELGKVRLVDEE